MPPDPNFPPPDDSGSAGEIVDLRALLASRPDRAAALFEAGFSLYTRCFPDPRERESRQTLWRYLHDSALHWRMFLVLNAQGGVAGGRHVQSLTAEAPGGRIPFAWGEHLYVDPAPECRRQGTGSHLVRQTNAILASLGCGIIFSEQNDPGLMTPEETATDRRSGITAAARLRFWGRLGYRALDAPYAQPSLDGAAPVFCLRLCCTIPEPEQLSPAAGYDGSSLNAAACLAMIRRFHATFVPALEADPASRQLREWFTRGPARLRLTDISEAGTRIREGRTPAG